MAVTWSEADPADGDVAFPDVAGEIRQVYSDLREMFNTALTATALPTPPATLANYDSQIPTPGPAVVPAPLRWDGAQIDLRGCTYRSGTPVTSTNNTGRVGTTWRDVAGLTITMTPVAAQSVLEFIFQGHFQIIEAGDWTADTTRRGEVRITRVAPAAPVDSVGTPLVPIKLMPRLNGVGTTGSFYAVTLIGRLTAISTSQEYRVQVRTANAAATTTIVPRGDMEPHHFMYIEHV